MDSFFLVEKALGSWVKAMGPESMSGEREVHDDHETQLMDAGLALEASLGREEAERRKASPAAPANNEEKDKGNRLCLDIISLNPCMPL